VITRNLATETGSGSGSVGPQALSAHGITPLAWVSPVDATSPHQVVVSHHIEVENVGAGAARNVVIQDTIGDAAALNADAYGPDQGLLVNGQPAYHDALRDPFAVIAGKELSVAFDRLEPGQRVRVSYQVYMDASDISALSETHVSTVAYDG